MGIFQYISGKLGVTKKPIYIISGLPRSGTSMMMKMFEAGGISPFIDNIRVPDDDNPKGYYELERVKKLPVDNSWITEARGKVIKVISMLLVHLPPEHEYKVIFMRRNMDEILASQAAMLGRSGKSGGDISDQELSSKFIGHLTQTEAWLEQQSNFKVLYVKYNHLLESPHENIKKIINFMNHVLNVDKMLDVIDPKLYRQRN